LLSLASVKAKQTGLILLCVFFVLLSIDRQHLLTRVLQFQEDKERGIRASQIEKYRAQESSLFAGNREDIFGHSVAQS
jgi:hypothetical protein